jgi:hypothetical protein
MRIFFGKHKRIVAVSGSPLNEDYWYSVREYHLSFPGDLPERDAGILTSACQAAYQRGERYFNYGARHNAIGLIPRQLCGITLSGNDYEIVHNIVALAYCWGHGDARSESGTPMMPRNNDFIPSTEYYDKPNLERFSGFGYSPRHGR